jgi:hypothetical protein
MSRANPQSTVCLFIGPSLTGPDLDTACAQIQANVRVLPPVQQGDLIRLRDLDPAVVAIVDGAFFQVPSVSHKEILLTLERGVRVLGASSLGALRAIELEPFGMEGVGRIFQMYKGGIIDGDDEVALVHGEAADGYAALSEPLVNIRYNLRRARTQGVISRPTESAVLATARRMHFTQRTYGTILRQTTRPPPDGDELLALAEFLRRDAVDLKRADALSLLHLLAERFGGATAWPTRTQISTHRTVYVHLFEREYLGRPTNSGHLADARVGSFYKLWSPAAVRRRRRIVLRCLALDEAAQRDLRAADSDALVAKFRHRRSLENDARFHSWLDKHCMWPEELEAALRDLDLECRLLHHYGAPRSALVRRQLIAETAARIGVSVRSLAAAPRMRPGIPWDTLLLREIKLSGEFRSTLERALEVISFVDDIATKIPGYAESLAASRLEGWFANQWRIPETRVARTLSRRGFDSYREFLDVARPTYVFERLAADQTTPLSRSSHSLSRR